MKNIKGKNKIQLSEIKYERNFSGTHYETLSFLKQRRKTENNSYPKRMPCQD
jgi:hypothetical protein